LRTSKVRSRWRQHSDMTDRDMHVARGARLESFTLEKVFSRTLPADATPQVGGNGKHRYAHVAPQHHIPQTSNRKIFNPLDEICGFTDHTLWLPHCHAAEGSARHGALSPMQMGLAALSGASVVGEDWSPQKGWQKPGESTKRPQYTVEVQLGYEVERGVGVVLQVPAGSSLAARGSVQPGDMIVGIDGQDIKRWSREMMLRALCGAKRSTVRLSLLREL
jgi:hypothetical protein